MSNEHVLTTTKEKVRNEDYEESDDDVNVNDAGVHSSKDYSDISPHAIDVLSHFTIISDSTVKTPKYRCKCCKYEFTASSTTRLKQHIMGYDIYASDTPKKVVKDIKECPNPFIPLKDNLIHEYNNNKLHKRPREDRMSGVGTDQDGEMQIPKSGRKKARHSEIPKTPVNITWNGKRTRRLLFLLFF
jgi:hypothetical protein